MAPKRKRASIPVSTRSESEEIVVLDLSSDSDPEQEAEPAGRNVFVAPAPPPAKRSKGHGVQFESSGSSNEQDLGDQPDLPTTKRKVMPPPPPPSPQPLSSVYTTARRVSPVSVGRSNSNSAPEVSQRNLTHVTQLFRKTVIESLVELTSSSELDRAMENDVLGNIYCCWEKYPLAFGSRSEVPQLYEDEDLSTEQEVETFMEGWLNGFLWIIIKVSQTDKGSWVGRRAIQMLRTFGQMIKFGNPSLGDKANGIVMDLVEELAERKVAVREWKIPVVQDVLDDSEREQPPPLRFEIRNSQDWSWFEEVVEVWKIFWPRIFQLKVIEKQRLLSVWSKVWTKMPPATKLRVANGCFIQMLPLMSSCLSLPGELVIVKLFSDMFQMDLSDVGVADEFRRFCELVGNSSFTPFPRSFALRIHKILVEALNGDVFCGLPESAKKAVAKVYAAVTSDNIENGFGRALRDQDENTARRATKSDISFQSLQFIREEAILQELKDFYERKTNRDSGSRPEVHQSRIGIEDFKQIMISNNASVTLKEMSRVTFKALKDTYDLEIEIGPATSPDDGSKFNEIFQKSSYLVQFISRIQERFMQHAVEKNRAEKLLFIPNWQLLTSDHLNQWILLGQKIVINLLKQGQYREAEDCLYSILDTVQCFGSRKLSFVSFSLKEHYNLFSLVCLPWLASTSTRFRARIATECSAMLDISSAALEKFSPVIKAKCIATFPLPLFLMFRDTIVSIILQEMETINSDNLLIIWAVVELMSKRSWIAKCLTWSRIVLYLHSIQTNFDLQTEIKLRRLVTSAVVNLPCIASAHESIKTCTDEGDKTQILLSQCVKCKEFEVCRKKHTLLDLTPKQVMFFLKVALPLMRSRHRTSKSAVAELLTTVRNHTHEKYYEHHLITEFTTMAANGGLQVACAVMKQLGYYLKSNASKTIIIEGPHEVERSASITVLLDSLQHFWYKSFESQSSIQFSSKILIALKELATHADREMTTELIKYALQLVMDRDSASRNMLAQSLCQALASNLPSAAGACVPSASDLLLGLRFELAPRIVQIIGKEFCSFEKFPEPVQAERVKAFLSSIVIVGDFKSRSFPVHYIPILVGEVVPLLNSGSALDKKHTFILRCLSEYCGVPIRQILLDGFPYYYRLLALKHGAEREKKCFKFIHEVYKVAPSVLISSSVMKKTLNEMVFYLGEEKDIVLKFIPQLLKKDLQARSSSSVPRSEIQEILGSNLMDFFIYFDTKMQGKLECVPTKRRLLKSFSVLIDLVGKTRITQNKSKVYTTLNSILAKGIEFYDLLYDAWLTFAKNLDDTALGQMSAQILSAVSTMHSCLPQKVESLISFFIISKKDVTSKYFPELYFVESFTKDQRVLDSIATSISSLGEESWLKFFEILVRESYHENSHIRRYAISKILSILSDEYENVKRFVLDREHPIVPELLSCFLNASRGAGEEDLLKISKCIGLFGAVDPYRFGNGLTEELRRKTIPVVTVDSAPFAAKYLDLLIREFQETSMTIDFDYCAYLIQQVLQHYKIQSDETNPIWSVLPPASRELITPLLNSKYKVDKDGKEVSFSCPLYLSFDGKTFDKWLSNWFAVMSLSIQDASSPAYQLFQLSRHIVPRNNRVASFLLPFVATYATVFGSHDHRYKIKVEIETILQRWIDQDRQKNNTRVALPAKETQAEMGEPEPEPTVVYDEDVIQFRCTQEVFSVLDHLHRTLRQARRQDGLQKANEKDARLIKYRKPAERIVPCFTKEQADYIESLLQEIPMDTVAQVALYCEDFQRALYYAELDLKKDPSKLQEKMTFLQKVYVSLNDMDSVIGLSTVRDRQPSMSETVCEKFAKGKVEDGVKSLEQMVYNDPNDLIAATGLLQAYLSLDEPRKAETMIKGCISSNPEWEVALEEFQIEAMWKLQDWSQLEKEITNYSTFSNNSKNGDANNSTSGSSFSYLEGMHITVSPSVIPSVSFCTPATATITENWMTTVIRILSLIESKDIDSAERLLNDTRIKVMNPLIAGGSDHTAYSRSYPNIVQLHILTEIEQVLKLMQTFRGGSRRQQEVVEKSTVLRNLIDRWDDREDVLLKNQKFVDPVLNVRKSLLDILKRAASPEDAQHYEGCIRNCWLTAAKVERKAGNFTRAHNCIHQAQKCMSAEVMIQHAKFLTAKGGKQEGLQVLNSGIPTIFPNVEDWKKTSLRSSPTNMSVEEQEQRKLCSLALSLQAKLSDELRLFDKERNLANYESCINVFKQSEKNYFELASYHDRLFSGGEKYEEMSHGARIKLYSARQELIVKFYARSLKYGCKYVYQSLPRLLSIWFDYASWTEQGIKNNQPITAASSPTVPVVYITSDVWSSTMARMNESIKMLKSIPAYLLLTAFSQLISRIQHNNPQVWEILKDLVATVMGKHLHQGIWMTLAVAKGSVPERTRRCNEIYKKVYTANPAAKKIITDYLFLADKLNQMCKKDVPSGKVGMDKIDRSLPTLLNSTGFSEILLPYQIFISPSIPPNGSGHLSYDAFPHKAVFLRSVENNIDVMSSIARPKKLTFVGSDGKKYGLLCKPNDDLRKDQKVMEVAHVVNWYLHRNPESRQRQLHIRRYTVTPLDEKNGVIEWVPNLLPFRGAVFSIQRERGMTFNSKGLRNIIDYRRDSLETKKKKFLKQMMEPYPPCFSEWFLNNFNSPQSWYNARMGFIRTVAVMSISGFILGLGDRHGENVCLEASTGEIVHVDFNCLFNHGESFQVPERVPFRLTQNMVEAMGPLGVEGVFRRSCEITLALFRRHKEIFMSVLQPFVFDPLVEWGSTTNGSSWGGPPSALLHNTSSVSNAQAVQHLRRIEQRINGTARVNTTETNTELSVEAQVEHLIQEATSVDNLCQMYYGWTPFI